jgi:hypothetical protein
MNVHAHRSIGPAPQPTPTPTPTQEPEPDANGQPGPRPPPKLLSNRALTALVSQLTTGQARGPEVTPGPLTPYIRKALER